MLVKTFQAGSMAEALQMVKADLGADAMIISSKKERKKGIFGFFSKPVFAITATVDNTPRPVRNPYQESKEPEVSTRDMFKNSMLEPLVREIRDLREKVDAIAAKEDKGGNGTKKQPGLKAAEEPAKDAENDFRRLQPTIPEVRKITDHLFNAAVAKYQEKTESVVQVIEPEPGEDKTVIPGRLSPQMQEILHELRAAGLEEGLCGTLIDSLQKSAGESPGIESLRSAAKEAIGKMMRCSGQLKLKKQGPKLIALVGPTGVGKTTTIAKLAAMFTLKKKVKVALVTTDNFRAGAVEQLRTYAKVLRLPLEVAATAKELEKVLANHADKDLILIDTTGKSPREPGKLNEIKNLLGAFDIEYHLCVAAATRDCELDNIIGQFQALPVHRLLFTKLDESGQLGCMANLQISHKLPLSFFTCGQRVPEDIEIASGKKIAELVMRT